MYRHSLFFETVNGANTAAAWVETYLESEHDYPTNDGESGDIEYRFWTSEPLSRSQRGALIRVTQPDDCEMNVVE